MSSIRTPRFDRSAKLQHIHITPRDLKIIRHVYRYRLLNSRQIAILVGGSLQNLLRRLKLLYNNRYLDRPRAQIDYYRAGGSHPIVYALGNHGVDLLQTKYGIPRKEIDWTAKNYSIKMFFLQHTLAVSEVLIRLESACQKSDNIEFVDKEEALHHLSPSLQSYRQPKWNIRVPFEKLEVQVGVVPDYIFGLRRIDNSLNIETVYFFLEVDRGTMPVIRNNLKQTSFYRKLLAYYETWKKDLHASLFGLKRFRILIIANSQERLANLISASKLLNDGKGSSIFLFVNMSDVHSWSNILTMPVINGNKDKQTTLLEELKIINSSQPEN